MTGFSRVSKEYEGGEVTIEIRAVNSRYLDSIVRLPREFSEFEPGFKKEIARFCKRGRVELTMSVEVLPGATPNLSASNERFSAYMAESEKLFSAHGLWNESVKQAIATEILVRRDIFSEESNKDGATEEFCLSVLQESLKKLREVQGKEGKELASDMQTRMKNVAGLIQEIRKIHDGQKEQYTTALREKVQEHLDSNALPEERLVAEVAILVERADITEEITRMESHLLRFPDILCESPCGRKLDFLLQECVREVNTIASKIQSADAQHLVVEAKAELERVKEQVQNLE